METQRIRLAALWVALMLLYLLGDVMRIFSGEFVAGEISGLAGTQVLYLGMAALMALPVVMVVLTVLVSSGAIRWVSIGVSAFFVVFNAIGLPTYPGAFDIFLIAVSIVVNVIIIIVAWRWHPVPGRAP